MSTAVSKHIECPACRGKGYMIRSRLEQDTSTSMLLGAAMGVGYFPLLKMTTHQELCERCHGNRLITLEK